MWMLALKPIKIFIDARWQYRYALVLASIKVGADLIALVSMIITLEKPPDSHKEPNHPGLIGADNPSGHLEEVSSDCNLWIRPGGVAENPNNNLRTIPRAITPDMSGHHDSA